MRYEIWNLFTKENIYLLFCCSENFQGEPRHVGSLNYILRQNNLKINNPFVKIQCFCHDLSYSYIYIYTYFIDFPNCAVFANDTNGRLAPGSFLITHKCTRKYKCDFCFSFNAAYVLASGIVVYKHAGLDIVMLLTFHLRVTICLVI